MTETMEWEPRRVPKWAVRAAHAVPLVVLPAGLWRIALVLGLAGWGASDRMPVGEKVYVLSLSVLCEGLAFLTLGLVRPWGEVVPRWVPLIGGRAVRARLAVLVAGTGAVLVLLLGLFAVADMSVNLATRPPLGPGEGHWPQGIALAAVGVCYAPLPLWGPLLAAVTVAYHRRRQAVGTPR